MVLTKKLVLNRSRPQNGDIRTEAKITSKISLHVHTRKKNEQTINGIKDY